MANWPTTHLDQYKAPGAILEWAGRDALRESSESWLRARTGSGPVMLKPIMGSNLPRPSNPRAQSVECTVSGLAGVN